MIKPNTMTKRLPILFLLILSTTLSGGKAKIAGFLNTNTWRISVGKTDLLIWMKHEIGDEVSVKKTSLKLTDTLHAQMYFCGSTAENATSVMTIKNSSDSLIGTYPHKNTGMAFEANAPLKSILAGFPPGETMKVYFSIFDAGYKTLDRTILLGKLKLK